MSAQITLYFICTIQTIVFVALMPTGFHVLPKTLTNHFIMKSIYLSILPLIAFPTIAPLLSFITVRLWPFAVPKPHIGSVFHCSTLYMRRNAYHVWIEEVSKKGSNKATGALFVVLPKWLVACGLRLPKSFALFTSPTTWAPKNSLMGTFTRRLRHCCARSSPEVNKQGLILHPTSANSNVQDRSDLFYKVIRSCLYLCVGLFCWIEDRHKSSTDGKANLVLLYCSRSQVSFSSVFSIVSYFSFRTETNQNKAAKCRNAIAKESSSAPLSHRQS